MTVNPALAMAALLVASIAAPAPALADDSCTDFKWDVTQERTLFAQAAVPLSAGHDLNSAPVLALNRLYAVKLLPQDAVSFAATPGKKAPTPGAFAGVATIRIATPGSYRVSIDAPFWIDVVSHGLLVAAKDFQGQHGCNAPHKIVEFDLAGGQTFVLQLSNAIAESVRLTITGTPPRRL
jgi:hypothetical protein